MKITLANRLVLLLAERKIRMATDFARLLKQHDYDISSSQASRYLKDDAPAMTREFIEAVCNALHCTANDLFEYKVVYDPGEVPDPRLRLPPHAVVTNASQAGRGAPISVSNAPEGQASGSSKAGSPKEISGWTGRHPAAGPKMAPLPASGKKK